MLHDRASKDACGAFFDASSFLSQADEVVDNKKVASRRLQNYVFSQGFCMAIEKFDLKRERFILRLYLSMVAGTSCSYSGIGLLDGGMEGVADVAN